MGDFTLQESALPIDTVSGSGKQMELKNMHSGSRHRSKMVYSGGGRKGWQERHSS